MNELDFGIGENVLIEETETAMDAILDALLHVSIPGVGDVDAVFLVVAGDSGTMGKVGYMDVASESSKFVIRAAENASSKRIGSEEFRAELKEVIRKEVLQSEHEHERH